MQLRDKENINASGIYIIRNEWNGKIYLGSAVNFRKRYSVHASSLKGGYHHSKKLQRSYNKYGAKFFTFSIVLLCAPSLLPEIEEKLILTLRPYYNTATNYVATMKGLKHSEETKLKISNANKGQKRRPLTQCEKNNLSKYHSGRVRSAEVGKKIAAKKMGVNNAAYGKPAVNARAINQYDLSGSFITTHSSLKAAMIATSGDFRNIQACCSGKRKTAYGFIWKYKEAILCN